ncbi:hypothetical protein [uncultured Fibrella sp.]|uniref:hypothetical protein n=1 Tax=uncultured Fibrella sp. TaxID=1284596 RepID=UPI0035CA4C32
MVEKKAPLTLSDLLNRNAPTTNVPGVKAPDERSNTPLGDREAIEKRTQFMRQKTEPPIPINTEQSPLIESAEPSESTVTSVDVPAPVRKQNTAKAKPKPDNKADTDKITRSIQFSRATYRQMEKTLNFIAYKSGRRNVSFPKYFEKLHELARQQPDLMNQLIAHFQTDLPD